jgi:molybdopterin synthase catalytic subunit
MIRVQEEDFDLSQEVDRLLAGRTDVGAVATFTGLVRGGTAPGEISAIYLEHYPAMTVRELERLEAEARTRFDLIDVLIIHRIGRLAAGQRNVLVVTLSAHRKAAFEAAEFLMDWLKINAPFWKAEERDGQAQWVAMKDSDLDRAKRWTDRTP